MTGNRGGGLIREDGTVLNEADRLTLLRSPFQEQKTVELNNVIELKSIYGITYRDVTSSTGSGAVSHNGSEFKLTTSASTGDRAVLESAERGRYVPGFAAEAGIGVRTSSTTLPSTGQEEKWGMFDDSNGFYFGRSSTGLLLGRISDGTDNKIGRSDWTGDPVDGTGPSGLELDVSGGHIFQIDFSWYGYGSIDYKIMMRDKDNYQRPVTLHRENVKGEPSVPNPNLPIRAELTRGGGSSNSLFVSGRKYAVVGEFDPNRRKTSERRISTTGITSTGFKPVISFRRKANVTNGAQFEAASVKVADFAAIGDVDMVWQVRTGATLSASSNFGTPSEHTASETAVESETTSTGLTGGDVIDSGLLSGGSKQETSFGSGDPIDFDFRRRNPVTLAVQATTGSGELRSAVFTVREEF